MIWAEYKVIPAMRTHANIFPILFCWIVTAKANVGAMVIEGEYSHHIIFLKFDIDSG